MDRGILHEGEKVKKKISEMVSHKRQDTTATVILCLYLLLFTVLRTLAVELVGARPLHLLTQTVLLLKHPTGVFVAIANANLR